MSELDQLKAIISSPQTGTGDLQKLLSSAEESLANYDKARGIIDAPGVEGWGYDVFQESLKVGGGATSTVTRAEWETMFPDARLRLRNECLQTLDQGESMFGELRSMIQGELRAREAKSVPRAPEPGPEPQEDKARRRFWKRG